MFGLNIRVVCVVSVRKNWFVGTIDTSPQKWYAATTAIDMLILIFILSKLCVWGMGGQKHLYPPCPPSRGNAVPYLSKIYGKPCTGGRNSVLNWVLRLNHLFKFFEVLVLVFACICNENDTWNTSDTSVLYSSKSTRCDRMIYFHTCSVLPSNALPLSI